MLGFILSGRKEQVSRISSLYQMFNQVPGILGSYDIFGKSIPGALLILGSLLLLPNDTLPTSEGETVLEFGGSLVNSAALVVIVLLGGLIIGQSVHTLADNTEKAFGWMIKRIIGLVHLTKKHHPWVLVAAGGLYELIFVMLQWLYGCLTIVPLLISRFFQEITNHLTQNEDTDAGTENIDKFNEQTTENVLQLAREADIDEEDIKKLFQGDTEIEKGQDDSYDEEKIELNNPRRLRQWFERRIWGIYDVFVSHRTLFERHLAWSSDEIDDTRWQDGSNELIFDRFRQKCEYYKDATDIGDLYPVVTSNLSLNNKFRASEFQARYSFCRSMWVVCFLLVVTYLLTILYSPEILQFSGAKPMILSDNLTSAQRWIPVIVLSILGIIFMDGAGTYKRHYIEYLLSDYVISVDNGDIQE